MRRSWALGAALVLAWGLIGAARAEIKLPAVIGDNMVLQSGRPVVLWGQAAPGEEVAATVGAASAKTTAAADGRWSLRLPAPTAAGPVEVNIRGAQGPARTLKNVVVGEVWVCSGQSNMEFAVSRAVNADAEIAAADFPQIRLFLVKKAVADKPQTDCEGQWTPCSPETVKGFSAVGYFFARGLHKDLNVPVAVIDTSWGGTPAEAWTSRKALEGNPALKPMVERWDHSVAQWPQDKPKQEAAFAKQLESWKQAAAQAKAAHTQPPRRPNVPMDPAKSPGRPANLYNGMIAPLLPLAIRGAIWYQGEANVSRAFEYRTLFPLMIRDWRAAWGEGDFPFGLVQLAPYAYGFDPEWCAELRQAQTETLRVLPHTGMAVTMDVGDPKDIHPKNKQEVGRRLELWALADAYGRKLEFSGPVYHSSTIEGGAMRLRFDHAASGLTTRDGKAPDCLTIAGADMIFHPAQGALEGDSLVVSSPAVPEPKAVRYGWKQDVEPNLANKEGLPAVPFETTYEPWLTQTATGGSRNLDALVAADSPLRDGDRIAFLGDSITQQGAGPGGYVWLIEDALSRRLTGRLAGADVQVIRAGISGHRVPNLQERLERDVLSKKPTVVFIYIGINDVWHSLKGHGTPKDAYEAGLRDIIGRIQKVGAVVVLATPTVIGEKPDGSNPLDKMLDEYAAISRKVAHETDSTPCDLRVAFVNWLRSNNTQKFEKGLLTGDGVHLSAQGNRLVCEQASQAIVAALKKRK